jgi:hypothetical protein
MSDLYDKVASQQSTMSDLYDKVASLEAELAWAANKLAVFKAPLQAVALSSATTTMSSTARQQLHAEVDHQPGNDENGGGSNKSRRLEDPAEVLCTPQSAPEQATCQLSIPHTLSYTAEAKAMAEGTGNTKRFVSIVLQDLYKGFHLKAPLRKDIALPPQKYTEPSSLKNTLELVEIVITDEERTAFTIGGMSATDLEKCGKSIEKKCMHQMLVYEGGDPAVEAKTGTTKLGTYLALGGRYEGTRNN